MRQRKRRVQISLSFEPEAEQELELTDADFVDDEAPVAIDVDLAEVVLDEAVVSIHAAADKRMRLGKETMTILAPMLVRPLARAAEPPSRFSRSREILVAVAALAVVLTSASVALAWT